MKRMLFLYKAVPRWMILIIDLVIVCSSFTLSYFIIKQFEFSEIARGHFFLYTGIYTLIAAGVFYLMRIHTGLIRYSNMHDMFRIFAAVMLTSLIYPIAIRLFVSGIYNINSLNLGTILLVNFFITSSVLVMFRTGVKGMFYYFKRISTVTKENVLIYGSESNAILIKQALQHSSQDQFNIVGFIDSDKNKVNSYIEQVKVYHIDDLKKVSSKFKVDKLILENEQLGSREKQMVIDICLALHIKVLTVPPSEQWVYGRLSLKQIQNLKIEDLLQRDPIVINNKNISEDLQGKRVLITGAAGSIGAEIVRQVLKFDPELIVLVDQAESALHEILLEMEEKHSQTKIVSFIASIRDTHRLQIPFREYKPQIVFHAAAYKHVPMMENHPEEAILTNVMGTKNVADLSVCFNAEKFVMISTDKAVNPTNVMGTSKRIAEMYVQSLNFAPDYVIADSLLDLLSSTDHGQKNYRHARISESKTKFITTRFGNVLDSNGSVIPRFRAQIQKGGPITVTHPDITRYFMTIPEAVQLVLEAGIMGNGGEIFIFDMGEPVKINDLAHKMIKLAGLIPNKDIQVQYTGLRPGEKLYEELLNEEETTIPTHHEKIKIAKVRNYPYKQVMSDIEELALMVEHADCNMLVRKMKEMVPEFISNNSRFEIIDTELTKTSVFHTPVSSMQ